ncbi:DUF167 domain-containing protein [Pelotomaculum propionicicum]|uniref:UPF0235 protein Pmgp_02488 n=1 Tax=Pelotomaculum propionicicum TaxID=258475 RepID=A0A4Y7RN83_9FIRM|nr:DUF167 domain-containing protein [Pelotomaculum propionicicum]NLI12865.1 YggU family protein [Peptococcaceae bacterium]TEB10291.1 hypothetical protein Pmgp_02488 [Pelotomaculum propionicicum]
MLNVKEEKGCVLFKLRVLPRSSKNQVVGYYDDAVKIRLTAAPLEGKANEACRAFLADLLSVPRSRVEIVSGEASRNKLIKVAGISAQKVVQVFSAACGE